MRGCRILATALVVAVAFDAAGCSNSGPKTVKVEGIVTLDGQPLGGATVRLVPVEGKGTSAFGLTMNDGSFRLACQNGIDGAVPGEYKVVIIYTAPEDVAGPADPEERMKMANKILFEEAGKKKKGAAKAKKQPTGIPPEYSDEAKTTLRATVPPPEGKVTLKLKSRKS